VLAGLVAAEAAAQREGAASNDQFFLKKNQFHHDASYLYDL
jgi:uncharacterized protein HemY